MQILIGLLEHLGDVVACEPVVRHIKHEYPGATLVWAIMPNYRELIDSNPLIDETIVLDCLKFRHAASSPASMCGDMA